MLKVLHYVHMVWCMAAHSIGLAIVAQSLIMHHPSCLLWPLHAPFLQRNVSCSSNRHHCLCHCLKHTPKDARRSGLALTRFHPVQSQQIVSLLQLGQWPSTIANMAVAALRFLS